MRPEKQLLLDEINDLIDSSKSIIVTKYNRLTPQLSWDFTEELSKSKSIFKIVKKRIFYKAAEVKDLPFHSDKFDGHVGVVFIEGDSLDATKTVVNFQKNNEDALELLVGQIDGSLCSSGDIFELSTLPGKDEMRSLLLGLFEAPMAQTLSTMESLLTSVMHCLENKKDKELEK